MDLGRLLMRIRLRDLRTLASVVSAGSMRKAAQELHMSLPAVSRSIADLESALEVQLLVRASSGVEPTAYGVVLVRQARVVFDELEGGLRQLAQLADPDAGEVRLGCMETLHAGLVGACVEELSARYPRLRMTLELGQAPDLVDYFLAQRLVDFVVARPRSLALPAGMVGTPLFRDRLRIVAGPASPYARKRRLSLRDLAEAHWIVGRNELEPESPLVRALKAEGLPLPQRVIRSGSLHTRHRLLAARAEFVTLVPDSLLVFETRRERWRALPVQLPMWESPTMVITLKDRALAPAAALFIDHLRAMATRMTARAA